MYHPSAPARNQIGDGKTKLAYNTPPKSCLHSTNQKTFQAMTIAPTTPPLSPPLESNQPARSKKSTTKNQNLWKMPPVTNWNLRILLPPNRRPKERKLQPPP